MDENPGKKIDIDVFRERDKIDEGKHLSYETPIAGWNDSFRRYGIDRVALGGRTRFKELAVP